MTKSNVSKSQEIIEKFDPTFSHVGWIPENKKAIKDFLRQSLLDYGAWLIGEIPEYGGEGSLDWKAGYSNHVIDTKAKLTQLNV